MRIAALTLLLVPSLARGASGRLSRRQRATDAWPRRARRWASRRRTTCAGSSTTSAMRRSRRRWRRCGRSPPSRRRRCRSGALPRRAWPALIGPHDDYVYAARVDRRDLSAGDGEDRGARRRVPSLSPVRRARSDDLRLLPRWRAPDGEIAVSPLRDELVAALPEGEAVKDAAAHDSEHSLEAHRLLPEARAARRRDRAASSFRRRRSRACRRWPAHLGGALAAVDEEAAAGARARRRGRHLHRRHALRRRFSVHAVRRRRRRAFAEGDGAGSRSSCETTLAGPLSASTRRKKFFAAVVNPDKPDEYRMPWCGRFSVPFGLMLLGRARQEARRCRAARGAARARRQRRHAASSRRKTSAWPRPRRRTSITS